MTWQNIAKNQRNLGASDRPREKLHNWWCRLRHGTNNRRRWMDVSNIFIYDQMTNRERCLKDHRRKRKQKRVVVSLTRKALTHEGTPQWGTPAHDHNMRNVQSN